MKKEIFKKIVVGIIALGVISFLSSLILCFITIGNKNQLWWIPLICAFGSLVLSFVSAAPFIFYYLNIDSLEKINSNLANVNNQISYLNKIIFNGEATESKTNLSKLTAKIESPSTLLSENILDNGHNYFLKHAFVDIELNNINFDSTKDYKSGSFLKFEVNGGILNILSPSKLLIGTINNQEIINVINNDDKVIVRATGNPAEKVVIGIYSK